MSTNTWIVLLVGIALVLVGFAFFLWSCALKWQERHEVLGGLNLYLIESMTGEQFMASTNMVPGEEPGTWVRKPFADDTTNGSAMEPAASASTAGAAGSGSYRKDSAGNTRHDALLAAQRLEREAVMGVANQAQQVAEEAALELMFRMPPDIIALADILPHEWATMRHALATAKVGNENTSAWAEAIDQHFDGCVVFTKAAPDWGMGEERGPNPTSMPASGPELSPALNEPGIDEAIKSFDWVPGRRETTFEDKVRADVAYAAVVHWADAQAKRWDDPEEFGKAVAKVHAAAMKGGDAPEAKA